MTQQYIQRWVFLSLLGGMFLLGFVSGSVSQRSAQAQVPGMGGALGSVTELGTSIVEMQQHVDGLQKNLANPQKSAVRPRGWQIATPPPGGWGDRCLGAGDEAAVAVAHGRPTAPPSDAS